MSQQFASRSTGQIVSLISGVVMILVSAPCVMAMIHDVITQADNLSGAIAAGTFFLVLGIIGGFMTWWGVKRPKVTGFQFDSNMERRLLNFARDHQGRVTVSLLAAESPLSLADCQAALESMELRGVCRSEFETSGALTYIFPDFVPVARDVSFDFPDEEESQQAQEHAQAEATSDSQDWS